VKALARHREAILAAIVVAMTAAIGTYAPVFVTPDSLAGTMNDTAFLFMMALAQMAVILTRGIDLSVAPIRACPRSPSRSWASRSASASGWSTGR